MSIIYSFLQKRKMHESQHGFIMIFIAYALSALMLTLGSDAFYNINTKAAGISTDKKEETQELSDAGTYSLQNESFSGQVPASALVNPYGLTDNKTTGTDQAAVKSTSPGGDTVWLLGNAMDSKTFDSLMEQMGSLDFVSSSDKKKDKESEKKKPKAESIPVSSTIAKAYGRVTKNEVSMLGRIVEAEASGEDMVGKILIVNVIFNRIKSASFPDTIESVIFQKSDGDYQFSPIADKRYWSVRVSDATKKAVERALKGEDYSRGALYFIARKKSSASGIRWFDSHLEWLFKHGGHEFYKNN